MRENSPLLYTPSSADVKGAVGSTEEPIGKVRLLTSTERHQLLVDWNSTRREYDRSACVHELFETAARRTPGATAAIYRDQQLTYEDLNARANRTAHELRSLGVRPDTLVGLYVERSLEMVVGILAILKAGGAYVPLDPSYPAERLSFLMRDSQIPVLLTQANLADGIPPIDAKVVCLEVSGDVTGEQTGNPGKTAMAEHLAYVIYTSGSTGTPKGVAMTHRPLVNLLEWHQRELPIAEGSRVAQFAPTSFDVSFQEMFSTFAAGATLVIVPEQIRRDPRALLPFLETTAIRRLFVPFVMLQQLGEAISESVYKLQLQEIVTAGEQLHVTPQLIQCFRRLDNCILHNHYGPTETHVVTSFVLRGAPDQWPALPPIGRPIANTQIYVLDPYLNPAPVGVAGEVYIGGDCLARGYLNRPGLTAERFIANPFSRESAARIYKTGDLGRYLPDGNIEYLGRIDNQVKLRGFRIEPGEIESIIRRIAGVRDAAVIVREDKPGDKRLVAYVVRQPQASWSSTEHVRVMLREQLPDYMVPSAVVALDTFPLTPNGKVDRRALPAPEMGRCQSENSFIPCRTSTERQLADIWEEILSINPIGVSDNFFDLGGDSLLGVRMMLRVEKTFAKSLPLAALYEAPTVELLSKVIGGQASGGRQWSALVPLQPNGSRPPFFWIHGETSDAFLPRHLGPDQPVYGLRHQSDDGRPARHTSVKEIAAHYLSEIRSVRSAGPYLLGGYCFGSLVAFEIAQQLRKEKQAVPLLALVAPDRLGNVDGSRDLNASEQPVSQVSRTVPGSWSATLRRRWNTFSALPPRLKSRYVVVGVSGEIKKRFWYPATRIVKTAACRICLGLGYRLPIWLRSFYILNLYRKAVPTYVPELYAGRVVVFDPLEDGVDLESWRRLSVGAFDVHKTPGNHTEVLRNPEHLKVWATALKAQLESVYAGKGRELSDPVGSLKQEHRSADRNTSCFLLGAVSLQDMLIELDAGLETAGSDDLSLLYSLLTLLVGFMSRRLSGWCTPAQLYSGFRSLVSDDFAHQNG